MYYNPSKYWSLRVDGTPTYWKDFGVGWKNGGPLGTRRRDRTMRRLHYEKFVYDGVFDLGETVEFESDDGNDGVEDEDDGVGFDDDADVGDEDDEDDDYNDDVKSEESCGYSDETESEDFDKSNDDVEDEDGYESPNEADHEDDPDDPDAETEHHFQEDIYDA
jgi:hypothetical protein